jgi:ERCC4-type nuclease
VILADIHESRSRVPEHLESYLGKGSCTVTHLEVGDYVFSGANSHVVTFERKEVGNLIGSIESGQLSNQLGIMLEKCDVSVLLVEGDVRPDYRTGGCVLHGHHDSRFRYDALMNCLHAWQLRGVLVERSINESDSAHRIISLFKMYQDDKSVITLKKKTHMDFSLKRDAILSIVAEFPGLGVTKARNLLRDHGSIQQICSSSPDELQITHGIGKELAKRIYETSREIWSEKK